MSTFRTTRALKGLDVRDRDAYFRRNSVEGKTFGFAKWFSAWAFFNVLFGLLMTLDIYNDYFNGIGWAILPAMTMSCFGQILVGSALFKLPTKLPYAVFILLFYFSYAIFSTVLANRDIARSMEATFGWHTQCLVWYSASTVSCMQATYCNPRFRSSAKWAVVVVCLVSCFVGICQNFKVPIVAQMFPIKLLSEEGILRATGLSNYPSQLGFQGAFGIVLVGAPIMNRNLKAWEWLMIAVFSLGILCAQYRSMYYSGLALGILVLAIVSYPRDRSSSLLILGGATFALAFVLILAPGNFSYGLRGAQNDPALRAREYSWKQTEDAQMLRPLTGIGSDYTLQLASIRGPGYDKWSTNSIDNLYLMIRTCYGWVGIALASVFCLIYFVGLIQRGILGSTSSREMVIAVLSASLSVLAFSFTGNSLVYTTVGCNIAIVAGLTGNTWKEELNFAFEHEQTVKIRLWVNRIARGIGLNLG